MHASSTTVSSFVFSYIIHAYFHLIYFFPLILSNASAGSRLLQSAPHSYPFRAPLGQSLCPGQKDTMMISRSCFRIRISVGFNASAATCSAPYVHARSHHKAYSTEHRRAQFWRVLQDIKIHLAEKRVATELLWKEKMPEYLRQQYCYPKSLRESIVLI